MPDTLKEKTARGLLWGAFNNGAQQLLNAIFGIVLAWHLTKADFGLVGMIMVFSAVAGIFQEGGFISALNKRKNITPDDYNSVFCFNVAVAATIYAVLFFAAPYIAQAYREPLVTPLARYVFLGFLISSFNTTPRAYLFRNLMVKQTAIISFMALLISGGRWGLCQPYTVHSRTAPFFGRTQSSSVSFRHAAGTFPGSVNALTSFMISLIRLLMEPSFLN